MALPTTRNTTYSAVSPIKSADLNALQDQIIGMKRPTGVRWIQPSKPNTEGAAGTMNVDGYSFAASGTFGGMQLGHWEEGTRITALYVRHLGTGVAWSATYTLNLNKGDGSPTVIGTLTIVNPPASWATYSVTFGTPVVLAAGQTIYLSETASAQVSNKLGTVGIGNDRL